MVTKRGGAIPTRNPHKYTWALREMGTCTLDANGNGSVFLQPGGARERWMVTLTNVTCSQPLTVKMPQMIMYRSSAVPANKIGGTFTATLDTDSVDEILLNMNEGIYFIFSGGDLGAVGTIRIEGTRYVWE